MDRVETTRILLVEDEPVAVRGLVRLFERCGFQTIVARSLKEARTLLASWDENRCGYAFVDNKLADGMGVDLVPELRRVTPPPAVALVSNWMTSDLAAQAFREGAVPMAKPEDEQTFRDLVALLDARRRRARGRSSPPPAPGPAPVSEVPPASDSTPPSRRTDDPLEFGPFKLQEQTLLTPTGPIFLTRAHRALLSYLAGRAGRSTSAKLLATAALGRADDGGIRSVYSHINSLRVVLGAYAPLVETVPGAAGYRLAPEIFER